ncbi:MAG: aminoacyl-tRNA hydrolase [Chitinispirillales bacterium]|nr:aminoacyl-tRNA hydrolase [Chitinispirillales bacterium]
MGLFGGLLGRLFGKGRPRKVDAGGAPALVDAAGVVDTGGGGINYIRKFKPELLVTGLGNPGARYDGTRHNVGFDVADEFCAALGGGVTEPCEYCEAMCRAAFCGPARKPVLIAKPLTCMNLSGDAVGALVRKYGLSGDKCLVIVDDFHIPLGKMRFRKDGSPGGHNGLKSVSAAIGTGYPRLRVGIGPLPRGASVIDFVLGGFEERERGDAGKAVKAAAEAAAFMIDNGIDAAMNRYN